MFSYNDAVQLTEESKRREEKIDNENYEYLMKVVGDPTVLDGVVEDYEDYIDQAIKTACLEKSNYAYVKKFSANYTKLLLEICYDHKTSHVEFHTVCQLIDRWFEDNLLPRYTETGYRVSTHTDVSYLIKW